MVGWKVQLKVVSPADLLQGQIWVLPHAEKPQPINKIMLDTLTRALTQCNNPLIYRYSLIILQVLLSSYNMQIMTKWGRHCSSGYFMPFVQCIGKVVYKAVTDVSELRVPPNLILVSYYWYQTFVLLMFLFSVLWECTTNVKRTLKTVLFFQWWHFLKMFSENELIVRMFKRKLAKLHKKDTIFTCCRYIYF